MLCSYYMALAVRIAAGMPESENKVIRQNEKTEE